MNINSDLSGKFRSRNARYKSYVCSSLKILMSECSYFYFISSDMFVVNYHRNLDIIFFVKSIFRNGTPYRS